MNIPQRFVRPNCAGLMVGSTMAGSTNHQQQVSTLSNQLKHCFLFKGCAFSSSFVRQMNVLMYVYLSVCRFIVVDSCKLLLQRLCHLSNQVSTKEDLSCGVWIDYFSSFLATLC